MTLTNDLLCCIKKMKRMRLSFDGEGNDGKKRVILMDLFGLIVTTMHATHNDNTSLCYDFTSLQIISFSWSICIMFHLLVALC